MNWKKRLSKFKVNKPKLVLALLFFVILVSPRYLHVCVPDFGARCDHSFFEKILYYMYWPYMLIALIALQGLFIVEDLVIGGSGTGLLYFATMFMSNIVAHIILFLVSYFLSHLIISSYNKFRR